MNRRSRILLADDHALILAGTRSLLDAHYDVVGQLGDGQSLVAAALVLRPDLIILDISMPVMNGIDAARQIRKGWPEVKLLFVSMHTVRYISGSDGCGRRGVCDQVRRQ